MKEKYIKLTTPEQDNALLTPREKLSFVYVDLATEVSLETIENIDNVK